MVKMAVIDSQSRRLGESPTMIYYPPGWPFGRYEHPAGGRFIREYGRTSPLPEALTELQRAEIESPPARAYLNEAWVPKSPELPPHEWGETTRPMSDVERAYLSAWGRPRLVTERVGEAAPPIQGSWWAAHKYPLIVAGVLAGIVVLAAR